MGFWFIREVKSLQKKRVWICVWESHRLLLLQLLGYLYFTMKWNDKDRCWPQVLIEKIHDGLRSGDTRLQATQLLLFLVNQQPPWTHSIVTRSVFTTLLKILKVLLWCSQKIVSVHKNCKMIDSLLIWWILWSFSWKVLSA